MTYKRKKIPAYAMKKGDKLRLAGNVYTVVSADAVHYYVDNGRVRVDLSPLGKGRRERTVFVVPYFTKIEILI